MSWWNKVFSKLLSTKQSFPEEEDIKEVYPLPKKNSYHDKRDISNWSPGLHPELITRVCDLLEYCAVEGLHVDVFQGFRSIAEQNDLYKKGRSGKPGENKVTNARGGYSWHNFGLAVDIVFRSSGGRWSWAEKHPWSRLGSIGKKVDLEWGGDWRRFKDRPHFQLVGNLKLSEARKLNKLYGLSRVWQEVT